MSGPGPAPRLDEPVPRALLRLALPVLASQALRLGYQWVDAMWVRGLGVQATAAVTTSVFVIWWVYSLHDVFGIGLSAYVSQLMGAGERARAGLAVRKGLTAALVTGLACAAVGLAWAGAIFAFMDPDGRVAGAGRAYLGVVLVGAPCLLMANTCEVTMRASGDTRTPLLIDIGSIGLNAVLAPLLIYGPGPFPRLGIAGAAWATVAAQAAMLASYLVIAARRHPAFPFAWRADGAAVRFAGLVRVGGPGALIGILFSAVYMAFVRAASPFGPAAVAIVGVANRLEAIQFVLALSLGLAGASLLGQALGAGRADRAEAVLRTGQRWIFRIALALTFVYLAFPAQLLAIFSRDPALTAVGVPYLRVLALAIVATGVEIVTAETVMASGHTRAMSAIYTVTSLARIPLAFAATRFMGLGVLGIAWLISVTCVLRALALVAWAARGTWKRGLAHELGAAGPAPVTPPEPPAGAW